MEGVVRIVGFENIEHARRVVVVGTPARKRHAEVALQALVQKGFPFFVPQRGAHKRYGRLPNGLQRGNLFLGGLAGGIDDLELKRFLFAVTRFAQKFFRFGNARFALERLPCGGRFAAALHIRRGELERFLVAASGNFGNDGAVGQEVERAADFGIFKFGGFQVRL